jgi:hypothetical protein
VIRFGDERISGGDETFVTEMMPFVTIIWWSSRYGLSLAPETPFIMRPFDWTSLFIKPYKVYTQIGFWLVVFLLYIFLKEYPSRMTGLTLVCLVLQETLELAIPSYMQNLLVMPFFKQRRWLLGIGLYLVQVVVLIYGLPYVLNGVGLLFPIADRVDWRNEHITFSMIAFTVIATIFKLGLDRLILEKQQKEDQLRHLKAQLNPHFLFNTLNNLYGLSVAESKKLPGLMLQLSELLRYSLYDTNANYVAVSKELEYIGNYVELERIRLSDKTDIQLSISGDHTERYIAPLLLIVFVENAFKHFSAARGEQAFVHVRLDLSPGGHLQLRVINSVDAGYVPVKNRSKGGLGLNNVRQRLDLIYPRQYTLKTNKGGDFFEVNLTVDLN